ncbi:MAG: hypothetical protein PF692_04255 [Kiritimatiellae bacterium]|jgi:hypothetical protein|nr:hypothetical protein [Kiritimatiellia bacterium]
MKRNNILVIMFSIILASNVANAADYLARAVITDVRGIATYSSKMQSGTIAKGLALPQSYTVQTKKDSTVDMILTSGAAVRVMPNSIVVIDTLDIISEGLPTKDSINILKRVVLDLKKGMIMVNIPTQTKNINFKVNTKFGTVIADKPAAFEVMATATTAEAKSGIGEIDVTSRTKTSTVPSGQSVIMMDGDLQLRAAVTTGIATFASTSSKTLSDVFASVNPSQTQDVIDSISSVINTPTVEPPTERRRPTPKGTEQPLPPDPINNGDPSQSTL